MKKRILALLLVSLCTCSTLIGCDNTSNKEGNNNNITAETGNAVDKTEDIYKAVVKAYGKNYVPSEKLDEEAITDLIGLTPDMYENCIFEMPAMSVKVDTFAVVKAAEGKTEEVYNKLSEYRDVLVNDTMQYPMNMLKIQASKVITEGDYVFFIMLSGYDNTLTEDDELLEYYKNQNEIAVEAISSII